MISTSNLFVIGFPSFNALNAARLFDYLGLCGCINPYLKPHLAFWAAHSGFTVSAAFENLNSAYPDASSFVLVKEDLQSVRDGLTYGFYNNLFDENTISDFSNYFGIVFNNGVIGGLENLVGDYYRKVDLILGSCEPQKFSTLDASGFGNDWSSLIQSSVFSEWATRFDPSGVFMRGNSTIRGAVDMLLAQPWENYFVDDHAPDRYPIGFPATSSFYIRPAPTPVPSYVETLISNLH